MNKHFFIDKAAITIGSLFFPKYFRDGIESPDIKEILQSTTLTVPDFLTHAIATHDITAETSVGKLMAGFRVAQWKDHQAPTIIYHHGASEIPFDYGFKNIFPLKKIDIPANLFLIRAAYHDHRKNFMKGMAKTENWLAMMAVSVKLIDAIIQALRKENVNNIIVSGTSLGGFITNLHHIHSNLADKYAPLLAGTAMHDAFLNSVYSRSVAKSALAQPQIIGKQFDFQHDFASQNNSNVFPLLAKYDGIIRYDIQKESYAGCNIATIDKGHTTGALSYAQLREHILKLATK